MEALIKAVKSLLSDIEGMQAGVRPSWFGPFSDYEHDFDMENVVEVEWPNLAISAAAVQAELAKL